MAEFRFSVDPDKEFSEKIKRIQAQTSDLTIPYTMMAKEWFKSNKAIFALKSSGKYADLSEAYKDEKLKHVGFIYPVLKRTGLLEKALTEPSSPNSVNVIINKTMLLLGVKTPVDGDKKGDGMYPVYLNYGTYKMAARPFILLGPEQVAPDQINRRKLAWIFILDEYYKQVMESA